MPKIRKIPEGYLTVAQAAERLGVSTVWMYEILKTGKIKTYKFGVTLIEEKDLGKLQPIPQTD